LLSIGWTIKRQRGASDRVLARSGWQDVLFAYHDRVTLGPTAMKRAGQEDRVDNPRTGR
jgi:hypothetical protein